MSKKSSVDSNNYYLYPEWFEGGNESNQSQPSTSSYSYPTLEYIWSNAVRLTRTTHSNLQDEIEYIEANLGGGNESCNCSALQFGIDSNTTKIENLSTIKLSRDGSQPMEGELTCNSGLKTDIIKARTQSIIDCQNQLRVYQSLGGDGDNGLWLGSDFSVGAPAINLYPYASSANGKIFIKTPRSDGIVVPRIEIPGKEDLIDIKIWESNIIPYDDNYQDLGTFDKKWKNIYANRGYFSHIDNINESQIYIDRDIEVDKSLWGANNLLLAGGNISDSHPQITLYDKSDGIYSGSITFRTPDSSNTLKDRLFIWGGYDDSWITVYNARLVPGTNNELLLGSPTNRWKEIYAAKGNFSGIVIPDNLINLGPYSVIVYKDDTGVYAKDPSGNIIAQGNAGTDDATVLKTALESGGRVVIMPATYTLYFTVTGSTFLITLPDYTVVDGLVPDKTKLEFYIDGSTPASGQHYNVMEIRTGSNCGIMNLTINGNKSYFAPKNYLQYLIYSVNKSNVLIENVNLYHSSRCGIVPESKYMKIRNVYAEDCRMPMNAITMEELEIDGYTAKTCDYAVYIEAGGGTNVILRNFYFSDCLRGVQSYGDLTNVVIKEGTIELKDSYDARGIIAQESNKELTIKNVRLPTVPHGFAFVVDGVGLGDAIISNCYCSAYSGFWAHNCIIDGGYYKATYLFTSYSNNLLVKNANLYTTYRMFYNHASKIHLENCILNSRASDGTASDITYRRCFVGDAPTENSSTAVFSGDGNTTQFSISHSLSGKPTEVLITPRTQDAAGNFYATCNGSQITVHYLSPPPSGTDNIELSWKASM